MTLNRRASGPGTLVTLRDKGQLTIPAELRVKKGWEEGARLRLVETDRGIVLEAVPDVMSLFGSLKKYAPPENWTMSGQELVESDRRAFEEAMLEDLEEELT